MDSDTEVSRHPTDELDDDELLPGLEQLYPSLTTRAWARQPRTGDRTRSAAVSRPSPQRTAPDLRPATDPAPDCGEGSYRGSGRLTGKAAVVTGGESGIGRAVAIAYAREGADVLISYPGAGEDDDARSTAALVQEAGRLAVLVRGDVSDPQHCRDVVAAAVRAFGRIDVLVHNASFRMTRETLEEISDAEWDRTLATNISALFHLVKAALPHLAEQASIIGSSSVHSDLPAPTLAPYAATGAAVASFCASLAELLGPRGIRVNSVAPGLGRPGRPAELAPVYVLLAGDEAGGVSGARIVTGGGLDAGGGGIKAAWSGSG